MKKMYQDIVDKANAAGSLFFSDENMKSCKTRFVGPVETVGDETWFITSDTIDLVGDRRTYNLRKQRANGHVYTLTRTLDGDTRFLSGYPSADAAKRMLVLEAQVARIRMADAAKSHA